MTIKEQNKEVASWRFKSVEYFYKGKPYAIDKTYQGRGKRLKCLVSNDVLLIIDMPLYKAGVDVIKHCYPIYK